MVALSIKPRCCLIANASLDHTPLFKQSVVYLTDRLANEPQQGLIINQPSTVNMDVLIDKFGLAKEMDLHATETPLMQGGPTNPSSVFFINSEGAVDILTETVLRRRIQCNQLPELFLGYSTWLDDRLLREIEQGYWEILAPKPGIFQQPIDQRYTWAQQQLGLNPYAFNSHRPAHG